MSTRLIICGSALMVAAILVPGLGVQADPLPNEILKFSQLPLGGNPNSLFPGHDEPSTAMFTPTTGEYTGPFAADDFADKLSTPIVHLDWWGSYLQNPNGNQVQQFLISFESDVPVGPAGNFSTPGRVLSSQIVTLGGAPTAPGTFTQTPAFSTSTAEPLFLYNAELATPFPEKADTVYWLKIVALTNVGDGILWGWHNRDYTLPDPLASAAVVPGEVNLGTAANPIWHFQDDAVTGQIIYSPSAGFVDETQFAPLVYNTTTDGMIPGVAPASEDLAFNLYTVAPEPASVGMLASAGVLLVQRRQRK